jgi:hypothetical protein
MGLILAQHAHDICRFVGTWAYVQLLQPHRFFPTQLAIGYSLLALFRLSWPFKFVCRLEVPLMMIMARLLGRAFARPLVAPASSNQVMLRFCAVIVVGS